MAHNSESFEVPDSAERVYAFAPAIIEARQVPDLTKWLNQPPGQRAPGPFPLPEPFRLQWGSGFPRDLPKPTLQFDKTSKYASNLVDAYYFDGERWPVSVRLREALQTLDDHAFDAIDAETVFKDGVAGPAYCMTELVRFVHAIIYDHSMVLGARFVEPRAEDGQIYRRVDPEQPGKRAYVFDRHQLGDILFWRQPGLARKLCKQDAKFDLEARRLTNLRFELIGYAI
jgi:hypothetical protein